MRLPGRPGVEVADSARKPFELLKTAPKRARKRRAELAADFAFRIRQIGSNPGESAAQDQLFCCNRTLDEAANVSATSWDDVHVAIALFTKVRLEQPSLSL